MEQKNDSNRLCALCDGLSAFLIRRIKKGSPHSTSYYEHHKNFRALETSAAQGCDLCRYLRRALILHSPTYEQLQASDSSVTVEKSVGEFCSVTCNGVDASIPAPARTFVPSLKEKALGAVKKRQKPADLTHALVESDYWFRMCRRLHRSCSEDEGKTLPKRLVDVGPDDNSQPPKVVSVDQIPPNSREQSLLPGWGAAIPLAYITLSYCWGTKPSRATLTNETLRQYRQEIPWEHLPATIKQAIMLTRLFRVRYLWVDALCIVQPSGDDDSDWVVESARMGDIYKSSILTIAATRACEAEDGFISAHHSAQYPVRDCRLSSQNMVCPRVLNSMAPTYDSVSRSPLTSRGWTFQEQLFSPRTLHWTKDGMFWECRCARWSEWHFSDTKPMPSSTLFNMTPSLMWAPFLDDLDSAVVDYDWYFMIEEFTSRMLSRKADKLVAFSSIASRFQKRYRDQYFAGLWRTNILEGLCWSCERAGDSPRCKKLFNAVASTIDSTRRYVAPSWSWAAPAPATICYNFDFVDPQSRVWHSTVLDGGTFVALASPDPMGAVRNGQLCTKTYTTTVCLKSLEPHETESRERPSNMFTTLMPYDHIIFVKPDLVDTVLGPQLLCMLIYGIPHLDRLCGLIIRAKNNSNSSEFERIGWFDLRSQPLFPSFRQEGDPAEGEGNILEWEERTITLV